MDKALHRLAVALRAFAVFWPIGWALYITLLDNGYLSSAEGTMVSLTTLLLPAALAFGLSWLLDRFPPPRRDRHLLDW